MSNLNVPAFVLHSKWRLPVDHPLRNKLIVFTEHSYVFPDAINAALRAIYAGSSASVRREFPFKDLCGAAEDYRHAKSSLRLLYHLHPATVIEPGRRWITQFSENAEEQLRVNFEVLLKDVDNAGARELCDAVASHMFFRKRKLGLIIFSSLGPELTQVFGEGRNFVTLYADDSHKSRQERCKWRICGFKVNDQARASVSNEEAEAIREYLELLQA